MIKKFINKIVFLCHNYEFKLGNFNYEFSYFQNVYFLVIYTFNPPTTKQMLC